MESGDRNFSDGAPLDTLKLTTTVGVSSKPESETAISTTPQSSLMCELSTDSPTVAAWISSLPDSRVSRSRGRLEAETQKNLFLTIRSGSLNKSDPHTRSSKTCANRDENLSEELRNLTCSGFGRESKQCRLPIWAHRILGKDCGWLPRPTATANQLSPSMAKWPGCRRFQALFGRTLNPRIYEWMMGIPLGAFGLPPLATHSVQQWLSKHGRD